MSRTVIIDGDIIVHRASSVAEESFEIECEEDDEKFLYRTTVYAEKKQAENAVDVMINGICKATNATDVIIALSSPNNFRKEINPDYKLNRKKAIKPLLYRYIREYFIKSGYRVYERPKLEADDVIGILATSRDIKGDKCVWSMDKDFKTIPCKFAKGSPDGKITKVVIPESEADWWFMYQTLIGDRIDGYTGCKGVGCKTAQKLLGKIGKLTLKEMWEIVLSTYKAHGQTEEEALLNARMARILRASDYDFKKKEIKLWKIAATD